jgi:hypothetical protein
MSPISLSERQFLAIANAACLIGPLSATRSATGGCRSLGNSAGGLTKSLKTPKGRLPPYRKKPHRRTRTPSWGPAGFAGVCRVRYPMPVLYFADSQPDLGISFSRARSGVRNPANTLKPPLGAQYYR